MIGPNNHLAHAAALAVSEHPGQAYNPLFLYGLPGLGKTHLLHSIADYLTNYGPTVHVHYATTEAFTNHFLSSLRTRQMDAFKAHYRNTDVLLLDDIQFLEQKEQTQQELFHTFDFLSDAGAQIVLSSDKPPHKLAALTERLRARFQYGLTTELRPPDLETRLAILRKRASHDSVLVPDPASFILIAERITSSIRALEGALIRVVAYASLRGQQITPQLVDTVLTDLYPLTPTSPSTIFQIQDITCRAFDITLDDLVGPRRSDRIVFPRHLAIYLARKLTPLSLPNIGKHFGNRDHATILHATRKISDQLTRDPDTQNLVETLTSQITRAA